MTERLGDAPIQSEYRAMMNDVAKALDVFFNGGTIGGENGPKKNGFVLLVFPFNDTEGRCNYISNATPAILSLVLTGGRARNFAATRRIGRTSSCRSRLCGLRR